jgi:hypothetical protein
MAEQLVEFVVHGNHLLRDTCTSAAADTSSRGANGVATEFTIFSWHSTCSNCPRSLTSAMVVTASRSYERGNDAVVVDHEPTRSVFQDASTNPMYPVWSGWICPVGARHQSRAHRHRVFVRQVSASLGRAGSNTSHCRQADQQAAQLMTEKIVPFPDDRAGRLMRRFAQLSSDDQAATANAVELLGLLHSFSSELRTRALGLLQLFSCLSPEHQRILLELVEDEQI